jgi:hypothetical protein
MGFVRATVGETVMSRRHDAGIARAVESEPVVDGRVSGVSLVAAAAVLGPTLPSGVPAAGLSGLRGVPQGAWEPPSSPRIRGLSHVRGPRF